MLCGARQGGGKDLGEAGEGVNMLKIYCIETVKNISLINKKENPLAYTYTQVIILWTSKFCLNMSD